MYYRKKLKSKVHVVENAIDAKTIRTLSRKDKLKDKYDIIFVGRLADPKDPLRFCSLINKLVTNETINIKAAIVGDGPLMKEVSKFRVTNNIKKHIHLIGQKKNPYPYIKNSKILCITSKREGFGLVACEAMALERPVVSTAVSGLKQIVNNKVGITCDTDAEFLNAIKTLLTNKNIYNKKKNKCLPYVEKHYGIKQYMEKIYNIYN